MSRSKNHFLFQHLSRLRSCILSITGSLAITLSLFLSVSINGYAQSHDALWKLLLRTPGQPVYIMNPLSCSDGDFFDVYLDAPIRAAPIKLGNELYLWYAGTGRLYQMKADSSSGSLRAIRLDSTKYAGYNYQAFPFSYEGNIYNIGGYGFWKRNGLLRKFNPKNHQWEIIPLNTEVPILCNYYSDYLFFDPSSGYIYDAGYQILNDGLKQRIENVDKVMRLDLKKMEWQELGDVSSYLKQTRKQTVSVLAMGPQGLLTRISYSDFKLLSFRNNKIYKLNDRVVDYFSFSKEEIKNFINFFIDSTLYSYNISNGKVDSMTFHSADLIDIGEPIYTVPVPWDIYAYIVLAFLVVIPAYLYRKRISSILRTTVRQYAPPASISAVNEMMHLEPMEEQVLQLIHNNTISSKNTTIDELNAILGLSRRSADVQKKFRSDCIQSINRKLSIRWGLNVHVIEKKRAEFDKRSFEYFIAEDVVSRVKDLLSGANDK
jgi:hypothetical protein